jgi:sugar phosphate isomerase/epimerase
MKLKLACADYTFPLLPHDDVLTLIAMLGIRDVDIGLFEHRSHLQPSDQFENVTRSAKALKKRLDSKGLNLADVFLQVDDDGMSYAINHPDASRRKRARDWYERTLDYAAACGAKHVTISPGVFFSNQPRTDSRARGCDELSWRIERAGACKIIMGAEPHIRSIASRPKSALRLISKVPGLTFSLDYGHFTCVGVPDAEVEPLIPHASHFHVRGARRGRLQATFQDNTIDFAQIVKVMKSVGYKGFLALEYVWVDWEGCNRADNLSETIRFRDFLRPLLDDTSCG